MALESADDEQVVRLTRAIEERRPETTGAPSVFALAGWRQPKPQTQPRSRAGVSAPDPRALEVVPGPPSAANRAPPRSPWLAVWDSMTPGGDGRVMTPEQAVAFACWARQHGHQRCLVRRKVDGATAHVWRVR